MQKETNNLSFDNLEIAFSNKSKKELLFSAYIFEIMGSPKLVSFLSKCALWSVKIGLPIKPIIKATIFKQFCGGESIEACLPVLQNMNEHNVKAILDYSVEGEQEEAHFDATKKEIIEGIKYASNQPNIPVACVKITGIGRFQLLKKIAAKESLTESETAEYDRVKSRLAELCNTSAEYSIPLYIDAEESWIQDAIDLLAEEMMLKHNKQKAIVFNTIQLYRWDRLTYLISQIEKAKTNGIILGVKIVRGAYIEKETARSQRKGYKNPIQPSKQHTDNDYNAAIRLIVDNISHVEVCAGTHNEESSKLLSSLMKEKGFSNNHPNIYFSQLCGMSDNITYNLAHEKYNVSKYLPYGPVESALPYLIRRAEENTSIAGQVGKELLLIRAEIKRRKQ